ncbi:hypothetical protein [Nostoc sp.]|uniref:hypothetical protein n=1 Tax=Nostoc sp. TaxID=1180 RepID=UPI002FF56F9F
MTMFILAIYGGMCQINIYWGSRGAALLYETLRVACFHVRVASRREVVRLRSMTEEKLQ